jgi:hypothetical protein
MIIFHSSNIVYCETQEELSSILTQLYIAIKHIRQTTLRLLAIREQIISISQDHFSAIKYNSIIFL